MLTTTSRSHCAILVNANHLQPRKLSQETPKRPGFIIKSYIVQQLVNLKIDLKPKKVSIIVTLDVLQVLVMSIKPFSPQNKEKV